jgi:DNA primase
MTVIDEIKARLDIVQEAGGAIDLERAGQNWKARCPFHEDDTPSFFIFPGSQRWKCFGAGCGKGGDLIDLVQELNGWDFSTALRHLAAEAGLEQASLSAHQAGRGDLAWDRQQVFGAAAAFFQEALFDGSRAARPGLDYARSRGWSDQTIREAGLGFFPPAWDRLRSHLAACGLDPEAPAAAALLGFRGDLAGWGERYDLEVPKNWLEQGRIPTMPPDLLIYTHLVRGRVVYLTGRSISGKQHWNPPHELAGPRCPYFNHQWWHPNGQALGIIVEGQADAVSLGQLGIPAAGLTGLSTTTLKRRRTP